MKSLTILAALALSGCATSGAVASLSTGLAAAGLSVDAYCKLAPEGREEIRQRLNLPHLIVCSGDLAPMP